MTFERWWAEFTEDYRLLEVSDTAAAFIWEASQRETAKECAEICRKLSDKLDRQGWPKQRTDIDCARDIEAKFKL